mgnify:FL=1
MKRVRMGKLLPKGEISMVHLSTYFSLENAGDKHDEKLLKRGLDMLPGVTSVSLSDRGCVAVDYDSAGVRQEQIRQKVQELGYQLKGED